MARKNNIHYVNNKEFSLAVVDYCTLVAEAKDKNEPLPIVTDYIAQCFLKIAEGLSRKGNFIRYTYREEMVMDAVENCLKAIENYNVEAATRTGTPNAFGYFTQISWYAFLRRIAKEKKQPDVKERYISEAGLEAFISQSADVKNDQTVQFYVDELRNKIDKIKAVDAGVKEYAKKERQKKKRNQIADSDLTQFMEDDE